MQQLIAVVTMLSLIASGAVAQTIRDPDPDETYLFYLHGRIIEDAGPKPTHDVWGLYDYQAVVDALGSRGAVVVSEQRPRNTGVGEYAAKVVAQIDTLVKAGVPESHIGVVGFSKGGAIAIVVSVRASSQYPNIRYVILAACADWLAERPELSMKGHVLTIFEASDDTTTGCKPLTDHQQGLRSFSHIMIDTGAQHGAFYLPREEWVVPTLKWIHGG